MVRAAALAIRGSATALPNPVVGCVLLDPTGNVVGEGWHRGPGLPHAEVVALLDAGAAARGATAVVTLEPCTHTGRQGPCTRALVDAGVARVVVGASDPWPPASGGAAELRAAGVDVETGVAVDAAEGVNRPWLTAVRLGRPFVTWKVATTLDGRVAAVDGTSRWITGAAARADVHRLRGECDVVLAGIGTVLADDPQLTVRQPDGAPLSRQPLRVVADSLGRTPAAARVRDDVAPTWIATAAELGADPSGRLDLAALLGAVFEQNRRHVLLEGGPRLAAAMVAANLVDRVVSYVAPALLGAGPSALADIGVTSVAAAPRWRLSEAVPVGDDVRLTLDRLSGEPAAPAL